MKPINTRPVFDYRKAESEYKRFASDYYKNKVENLLPKKEKVEADLMKAIAEVERNATARLLTVSDILDVLEEVETLLHIPKKAMNGIKILVDVNAQTFPNAYKWRPMSTIFKAEFRNGSWFITDIERWDTHRESRRIVITHTEESKAALIEKYTELR